MKFDPIPGLGKVDIRSWQIVGGCLVVVAAYLFAETRHPALNQDDTNMLAATWPYADNKPGWARPYQVLFEVRPAINEFRTYALARALHFVLFKTFSTDIAPYYWVMAIMAATTACLAGRALYLATDSRGAALAAVSALALGPFSLYQTFHHAAYVSLPLLLSCAYLVLVAGDRQGRLRKVGGVVLCVTIVLTGEVATFLLTVAIGLLLVYFRIRNDRSAAKPLAIELIAILATLALLYLHYRLAIHDPGLTPRFDSSKQTTLGGLLTSFAGFQSTLIDRMLSFGITELLATGVTLDAPVAAMIGMAALVVVASIVAGTETALPWRCILPPAGFVAVLLLASEVPFLAAAAPFRIANFPPRYLHVSGALAAILLCVAACGLPSFPRKLALVSIVVAFAFSSVVTFAIKVPTIQAAQADLHARILAAGGKGRVVFEPTPGRGGVL